MFINNISTKKNENYFGIVEEEEKKLSGDGTEPVNPVDEAEMFDYVFCMGAWSTDLFDISSSEPVKLEKTLQAKERKKEGGFGRTNPGDTARDRDEGMFYS
jgi:hypothetical protein